MATKIDAEKLKSVIKAQINERKNWMKDVDKSDRQDQLWSDLNGEDMSIIQIINSLQQEAEEEQEKRNNELQKTSIEYRDSLIKHIEAKRPLPSLKGQLLHDFKNELNTMEQILNIKSWSQIQYAIFEKVALVFYDLGLKVINKRGNS